ncbi:zinc finger, matrin type 2 [Cladochytrium replicatum]|nr:zinc finger, matrin type 2 [Cladochytrium replicatum]
MSQRGVYASASGDTDFRKRDYSSKKDKDEEEKVRERKRGMKLNPAEVKPERKFLEARDETLDLTSNLNKTQVVTVTPGSSKQPGFWCEVCKCTLKDSVNYVDHLNGTQHQLNLGVSMKVTRSSVDQVKARLEMLKRKADDPAEIDIETRLARAKKQDEEERERKKEKKREKKRAKKEEAEKAVEEFADDDIAAMMGFGGFSSSNGKNKS